MKVLLLPVALVALAACERPADASRQSPTEAQAPRPTFDVRASDAQSRMAAAGGPAMSAWRPLAMVDGRSCVATEDGWKLCPSPDGQVEELTVRVQGDGNDAAKSMSPIALKVMVSAIAPDAPEDDWPRIQRNLLEALSRNEALVFVDDGAKLRPIRVETAGSSYSLIAEAGQDARL